MTGEPTGPQGQNQVLQAANLSLMLLQTQIQDLRRETFEELKDLRIRVVLQEEGNRHLRKTLDELKDKQGPQLVGSDVSQIRESLLERCRQEEDQEIADAETIHPEEAYWRDRYHLFASKGFRLRNRLHPEWVPSWRRERPNWPYEASDLYDCEDFEWETANPLEDTIDARDTSGELVLIRRMAADSSELDLLMKFSAPHAHAITQNHCIPVFSTFPDPDDPSVTFVVMPFLMHMCYTPKFETVNDFMEFGEQVLEGLAFFHSRGISNILYEPKIIHMDARCMYPKGSHPISRYLLPDFSECAPHRARAGSSVVYYFGHLRRFVWYMDAEDKGSVSEKGKKSKLPPSDAASPEHDLTFGTILSRFHSQYSRLSFLQPLATQLCHKDPSSRPSAASALHRWGEIRQGLSWWKRTSGLGGETYDYMEAFPIPEPGDETPWK